MAIRYSGSLKINMKRLATNNRHLTALAICRVTISRGKQAIWSRELGMRAGPGGKLEAEDYDDLAEYALREASVDVSIDGVRLKGGGGYYVSRSASGPRGTRPNGAKRKPSTAKKSRPNGATFAKVTGDRARGSTVRGARHNYRTVEVLVYQSPNSMATARTYEIVTDASYNMGDGAYTTDVWKLPEPVAVQQAIYTAVRNLRGGGRSRRAPVQAE